MPRLLKSDAIRLLDASVEAYWMAIIGINIPMGRKIHKSESKYSSVMGLLGASVELLGKACLVEAKGLNSMYVDNNPQVGIYKFGSEVLDEIRKDIKNNNAEYDFLYGKGVRDEIQEKLLRLIEKFKLLQTLRANGLHAGIGCSKDIVVVTANDVYEFISILALNKKMGAYLKNIPKPEEMVRDREIILEDLSRRLHGTKDNKQKAEILISMYLVLPYIPEIEPEWLQKLEKAQTVNPQNGDLKYLINTMDEAHSIYLLKNRGGTRGIPVKVDNSNPDALPIAIQNLKRELNTIPDKFNNDVLQANTRLKENRLDLPLEDFIVDLYGIGIENAKILVDESKLTAQQTWAYVAAALECNGAPRPFWFLLNQCDEKEKILPFLRRAKGIGNAFLKRRYNMFANSVDALINDSVMDLSVYSNYKYNSDERKYLYEIIKYNEEKLSLDDIKKEISPDFLIKNPLSECVKDYTLDCIQGKISIGNALESILNQERLTEADKKVARLLLKACYRYDDRNGLVAVMRTKHLNSYVSSVRKMMYYSDFICFGPRLVGIDRDKYISD